MDKKFVIQFEALKNKKIQILLHQGVVDINRGGNLLVEILNNIPEGWLVLFIGCTEENFDTLKNSISSALHCKMYYMGFIPYLELNSLYNYVDAAVLFYNSKTFNNKYCAPNRLYSAVNNGVPIIVNGDNVSLSDFIKKFNNGVAISASEDIRSFFENYLFYKNNADSLKGKYQYGKAINILTEEYKEIC